MEAVIISGGLGTRLKPYTGAIPKPLLPIGDKALLEIQIEQLNKHGFNEIILATNYKSRYIEKFFGNGESYGVKLTISKEDEPLGTAGPLSLIKNQLKEPFLVINGDILTKLNFKAMFNHACLSESIMSIGTKVLSTPSRFGKIYFDGEFITGVEEKPEIKTTIMAGIYVFKPEILDYIPSGIKFGMDELILALLHNNRKIIHYNISEYWLDIGKLEDYSLAQEIYEKHFTGYEL